MEIPAGENPIAQEIARTLRDGFNRHYRLFRECSAQAKTRFEQSDWLGLQQAVRERIAFYDSRVSETAVLLHEQLRAEHIDDNTWQLAKLLYIGLLTNHKQPELAETFFNSVFCKIMHRTYFHNDFIFVRPAVSTEFIPMNSATRALVRKNPERIIQSRLALEIKNSRMTWVDKGRTLLF